MNFKELRPPGNIFAGMLTVQELNAVVSLFAQLLRDVMLEIAMGAYHHSVPRALA